MKTKDKEFSAIFSAETEHVDMIILNSLLELQEQTGSNLVERVINLFINDTPEQIKIMQSAVDSNNPVILHEVSHRLKSSSALIGALTLSSLFLELEDIGRQNTLENAKILLQKTEVEYKNVEGVLISQLIKLKMQEIH